MNGTPPYLIGHISVAKNVPIAILLGNNFLRLTCKIVFFIEAVVERLLPLGFPRASIRKELYLSDGDPNVAALQLLKQRKDNEEQMFTDGGSGERGEGTEEKEVEEQGQGKGEETEKRKLFTIGNVWVGLGCNSSCIEHKRIQKDLILEEIFGRS